MAGKNNRASSYHQNDDILFERYKKDPSKDARNEIINKYLYLPEIIAKKFTSRGIDYEDLYQVACLALIKAVERFNTDLGVKFVSFATPTIVGEIKRYFRDKGSVIRIPRRIYETYQKVSDARDSLIQELQRAPRVDEIAARLGISEENVLEIMESWNAYNIQSFEQSAYQDEDVELYETIGAEDDTFEKMENKDFIKRSLEKFNDVEKEFIKMRYYHRKTQKEIADVMKVSQMYVSRMERRIVDKFRKLLNK